MAFKKGNHPMARTGFTRKARELLARNPAPRVTAADIRQMLVDNGESPTKKQVGNLIIRLVRSKNLVPTKDFSGRQKLYSNAKSVVHYSTPEEKWEGGAVAKAVEDKALQELEEQLLAEMQKNEDLQARIAEMEKGLEVDFLQLGKSVYLAHQDLARKYNELESQHRDETAKWGKLRSEDRSMIGSLQKKITKLEAELRAIRAKLQSGIGNGTPDMGIFNSPRLKGSQ